MKAITALFLAGCAALPGPADSGSPDDMAARTPDMTMTVLGPSKHSILPSDTDPRINTPNDAHTTIAPGGAGNGRMLVFFSGSGGTPAGYDLFLDFAASIGYHTIGLGYPDKTGTVSSQCGTNLACYGTLREETWSGQDVSSIITVDSNNCIHNRLNKLLQYLVTEYPDEGWDTFYFAGEPAWNKTTLSGHSQGGGFAVYIAASEKVARVATFSAPTDASNATTPPTSATWLTQAHVTPIDRYFGIDHQDDAAYNAKVMQNFITLGLDAFGAVIDVDTNAPPYTNSHRLTASRTLTSPHNQIITDSTPLGAGGVPVYEPMWQYMITP
jgi:hypothetical protein